MNAASYALIVVLVVAAIGIYAFVPLGPQAFATGTSSSTTSTTATSCSSSTTLGGQAPASFNGTISFGTSSQVRVDFVKALVYPAQGGPATLRFEVGFTNIGNSSIYILTGCGSTLNSTIISGSDVVKTSNGGARCLCAEAPSPLGTGLSASEYDPGCWSGYSYQVIGSGTITAKLLLSWYGGSQLSAPGSLQIVSNFTIS